MRRPNPPRNSAAEVRRCGAGVKAALRRSEILL